MHPSHSHTYTLITSILHIHAFNKILFCYKHPYRIYIYEYNIIILYPYPLVIPLTIIELRKRKGVQLSLRVETSFENYTRKKGQKTEKLFSCGLISFRIFPLISIYIYIYLDVTQDTFFITSLRICSRKVS